ncbi:MAG: spore coat protein CotJB [Clostridiales bacterium]|nr:spore coat protein CotJB [Clostridiales bacterium]
MCPDRQNLLKEIMAIDFFLYDLALYLDTHSGDRRALLTFNDYLKRVNAMKENYERAYGPLTYDRRTNGINWQWIDCPWPWEYSYN